ncbi:MAG: folate family ECF transporter S component [Clostridia bacterium]|nr:folate family ECF transporter S component [Clostridia bacterium]
MKREFCSTLYKTPLSPGYWREAFACLKDLRCLVLAALLVAGRVAVTSFYIPLAENLKISFGFFLNASGAFLYGPVVGLLTGFATDILGFFIHPQGAFFPGYTLTAMMGSFVYGLFLFRAKITPLRLFFCKLSVNLFVNVGLNCVWSAMLYSKGYLYYLFRNTGKNLLMLPIELLILLAVFRLVVPIATAAHLAPEGSNGLKKKEPAADPAKV